MGYNYFLAVVLDETTKKEIIHYGLDLSDPRLQHTTPLENLHITVGYIGPIPEDLLPKVTTCFKALETLEAFPLPLAGVGFFGGRSNFKRYIGVEIADESGKLKALHQDAQALLEQETSLTFRGGGREFKPHITFQLLKQRFNAKELQQFMQQIPMRKHPVKFRVHKLGLWYRNPKTQRYESVREYILKEATITSSSSSQHAQQSAQH